MSTPNLQPFIHLIKNIQAQEETARYLAVSGLTLLVYDWLCNLDLEVEHAWMKRWSFARIVYHINRILPVLNIGALLLPYVLFASGSTSPAMCKRYTYMYSYGVVALIVLVCTTSIIRCWALYGQRWVLWVLVPALVVTVGHALVQVSLSIERGSFYNNPLPDVLSGCLLILPGNLWLAYFSGVIYETAMFSMISWKIWSLGRGLGLTPLMWHMLKCGIVFFAVNLAVMLFSCIGSAFPSTVIMANGSGLLTALSSLMCSRVFFSMHEFFSHRGTVTGLAWSDISDQDTTNTDETPAVRVVELGRGRVLDWSPIPVDLDSEFSGSLGRKDSGRASRVKLVQLV